MDKAALTFLNDRLKRELGFSPEDLAANQQGVLSDHQHEFVRALWRSEVRRFQITYSVLWVIFMFLIIGIPAVQGRLQMQPALPLGAALVITAVFGVLLVVRRTRAGDLKREVLRSAEGKASTDILEYNARAGWVTDYELSVGEVVFLLKTEDQLLAFENGIRYRVYYIRFSPQHVILSAEALDSP